MATKTVNPYTFVPLGKKSPSPLRAQKGACTYTGVMRCTLTAKTPLLVPDAQNEDFLRFFRVEDKPVIPGSSIRGVIRSAYEAVTDSCMRVDDNYLYARSKYKKAGLLQKVDDAYYLYEAKRYPATEWAGKGADAPLQVGERCSFDLHKTKSGRAVAKNVHANKSGEGVFHKANSMRGRMGKNTTYSSPSVFVKESDRKREIDARYIECLRTNVEMYDTDGKGKQFKAGRLYKQAFERLVFAPEEPSYLLPVWYLDEDGAFEFAPSQVSRSVYAKTPADYIKALGLDPCSSVDDACPACALFGFVTQGESVAKAGKVRFSDAIATHIDGFETYVLPALMEPRTSTFEFYLKNPDNRFAFTPNDETTELSGRKFYWHHQEGPIKAKDVDRFSVEAETVKIGSTFAFDIYLDEVTQDELDALVFVVTLGDYWQADPSKRTHFHKIGHGKPVGLGSADITVESILMRKIDDTYAISDGGSLVSSNISAVKQKLGNKDSVEALLKVTDFGAVGKQSQIDYPRLKGEIYTWFGKNKETFDKEDGSIGFKEVLKGGGEPGYVSKADTVKGSVSATSFPAKRSDKGNIGGKNMDALAALLAQMNGGN